MARIALVLLACSGCGPAEEPVTREPATRVETSPDDTGPGLSKPEARIETH